MIDGILESKLARQLRVVWPALQPETVEPHPGGGSFIVHARVGQAIFDWFVPDQAVNDLEMLRRVVAEQREAFVALCFGANDTDSRTG